MAPRSLKLILAAVAAIVLAAGCSSEDDGTVSAPTAAAEQGEAAEALRIVGRNLRFDVEELTAASGAPFTIVFENEDRGIPHNLAVYRSGPPAEDQIAATELENGPVSQTLEVPALEPGRYFYQCDAHTATMTGTLTVR